MRVWSALFLLGLALVVGILLLRPDLRGWTPANWSDPTTRVESIGRDGVSFTVGDCLPCSIEAYGAPDRHEYVGTATMTVFTCRSRSSALMFMSIYLLLAVSYPAYRFIRRKRNF